MTLPVMPLFALAHVAPDALDELTEIERFVLPYVVEVWLRPEQIFPDGDWRALGFLGGRGLGKTFAIASQINRMIERGEVQKLGLAAPTLERVDEVQIEAFVDTSPPWFKAERWRDTVRWPNGVIAECHSPETPENSRSSNFDLAWLTELVAWSPTSRGACFKTITTACRTGRGGGRYIWDTTSKGMNELILTLLELHDEDPEHNPVIRGTMFDNPLLTGLYLRGEGRKYKRGSQEAAEEMGGRAFTKAAAALWDQAAIRRLRELERPRNPALTVVAVDPALSADQTADETGIVIGDRGRDGHSYLHADESGHHGPGTWAKIVVDWCDGTRGTAAGVVIERNHMGDSAKHAIVSEARIRRPALRVEDLPIDKPMPARREGTIYIREVTAASSKTTRASGPAVETDNGRVHHVGTFEELEGQLTTFVPGTGQKSPNRYDAYAYLITELAGLKHDAPGKRVAVADVAEAQRVLLAKLRTAAAGRRRIY